MNVNLIFSNTFGGLQKAYYFRQLFFGSLFMALMISVIVAADREVPLFQLTFFALNTLLYPYSRYLYESVIGFFMGENVFFVNAIFMLFIKAMTMAICWSAAIFIAPIGLAYLYYQNSKTQTN